MDLSRFKTIKIVMQRAQMNNCPIVAIKTTLYMDSVTGKKVFTNEFKNVGDKTITSYSVKISCFDENIKLVGTIKDYKYDQISLAPGEEYGTNKIIACPSDAISSFAVAINHVELEDDYYWDVSEKRLANHKDELIVEVEMAPELPEEAPAEETVVDAPIIEEPIAVTPTSTTTSTSVTPPVATTMPVDSTPVSTPEPVKETYNMPEVVEENLFASLGSLYDTVSPTTSSILPAATPSIITSEETNTRTQSDEEPVSVTENIKEEVSVNTEVSDEVKETVSVEKSESEPTAATEEVKEEPKPEEKAEEKPEQEKISIQVAQNEPKVIIDSDDNEELEGKGKKKKKKHRKNKNENPDGTEENTGKKGLPGSVKALIVVAVLAILSVVAVIALKNYQKISKYNQGTAFFNNGQYEEAITAFSIVSNYKDSQEMLNKSKEALKDKMLKQADVFLDEKKYLEALDIFNKYNPDEKKLAACYEGIINDYLDSKEIAKADAKYTEAEKNGLKISKEVSAKLNYLKAKQAYDEKKFEYVLELLNNSGKYEDSEKILKDANYEIGKINLESQQYERAIECFERIADYKDAKEQVLLAYYSMAEKYATYNDYENAVKYYEQAGEYKDSKEKILEMYYGAANNAMDASDFQTAMDYFQKAGEYMDAKDLYNKALYSYAMGELKKGVTPELVDLLGTLPKNFEDSANVLRTLKLYVDYVGEYEWNTSNDKELNARGGFSEHLFVTMTYENDQVLLKVNEYPIDLKTRKYDSKTDSDTYTISNSTTITRTFNGKLSTYKKVKAN